jgi:hypothetical protein
MSNRSHKRSVTRLKQLLTIDALLVFLLSAVFLSTRISKAINFSDFRDGLASYVLLPKFSPMLALPLILVEMWIGIGLIFQSSRKTAAIISSIVILLFTTVIGAEYLLGSETECGCGIPLLEGRINLQHLLQNLILLVASLVLWKTTKKGGEQK